MPTATKIEWVPHVWNPITGCPGPKVSEGCTHCYAERMAVTRLRGRMGYDSTDPFKITYHYGRYDQFLKKRKHTRVFVNSMGDLFHPDVEQHELDCVFAAMLCSEITTGPSHEFLILTKRPDVMAAYFAPGPDTLLRRWGKAGDGWLHVGQGDEYFSEYAEGQTIPQEMTSPRDNLRQNYLWPLPNVWLGVTVCNQEEADAKIPVLMKIPAVKRFVSIEPMLGPIDLTGWGDIRQGENQYPERWADFTWPEWVPAKVRLEIESFWSWEAYKRTPREWAANAVQNEGGIELGSLVGVDNTTYLGGKEVRPVNDYRAYRTGRFVHAWNNMCRVVYDDGTFDYASYNGRFFLSKYPTRGSAQYKPLINWVICGGETGPGARPMHPDCVRSLRDQCSAKQTPFFFKSWGEWGFAGADATHALTSLGDLRSIRRGEDARGDWPCSRVGKKRAGRLLDGQEYNGMPEVSK